jgi:hypothetical protein
VPPQQVKHVLRALLYAIFFHRLMDNVEPETWDILETHVVSRSVSSLDVGNPASYRIKPSSRSSIAMHNRISG